MSRITKRNDAYLARVQASMDFERKVRQERYDRRNHFENTKMERRHEMKEAHAAQKEAQKESKFEAREEARARNLKIKASNDRYSEMWIATTGLSVATVLSVVIRGGDTGHLLNRLEIRAYNKSTKSVESVNLMSTVKIFIDMNFPEAKMSNRGQVEINDLVLPSGVYYFMRDHWLSSGAIRSNPITTENFSTDTINPMTVPAITV